MAQAFDNVLKDELAEIGARRAQHKWPKPPATNTPVQDALNSDLLGVALSGGGIRSATFNLGVIQGLCKEGLLPYIDYLSTVSGGGYIGSWLHAVISRCDGGRPRKTQRRLLERVPKPPDQDPITWLRKYSNYLAPRVSLFSPDVWTLFSIWLRNFFLNQCVLVLFLAAVLMLPLLVGRTQQAANLIVLWWWIAAICLLIAVISIGRRLHEIADRELNTASVLPARIKSPRKFVEPFLAKLPIAWLKWPDAGLCAALVFAASILTGWMKTDPLQWPGWNGGIALGGLFLLFVLLQWTGGFGHCFNAQHDSKGGHWFLFLWPPICTIITSALLLGSFFVMNHRRWEHWDVIAWGPAMVAGSLITGVALLLGLMGGDYPDACREWLSRMGAVIVIMIAGWCAAFAFGIFVPLWIAQLFDNYWASALTLAGGWIATSAAGVFAGYSSKTKSANGTGPLELIVKIAPTVFLIGYLALISIGCHALLRSISGHNIAAGARSAYETRVRIDWTFQDKTTNGQGVGKTNIQARKVSGPAWARTIIRNHWSFLLDTRSEMWIEVALILLASLLVSLGLGSRVNINEFSIHHLYKNRLVRCYLGASQRWNRRPNSWTGFDPKDDLRINDLTPAKGYFGPFAIINTALNVNRGSELAKQDRKASSFVFTPLSVGYQTRQKDSYTGTVNFLEEKGPALGTCMGISGAAANPNMGYHTSGPMAFLLTIFNLRLGWWVGNPAKDEFASRSGPVFSLPYLLNELLARTNDWSNYLNLSDGGHFDNIGLYELVRRRCLFIIVGDGEQDAEYSFGSLASTMRRCRADFGVEIDLDFDRIRAVSGRSTVHAVIGEVCYPERDANGNQYKGTILYIKASVTGDETEDIKEFRLRFPQFPHQSTGDQFFDEPQFESYRKLGFHIVESIFERIPRVSSAPDSALPKLFSNLRRKWYPPSLAADGVATQHAAAYSALMARLAADPDLRYLDSQVLIGAAFHPRPMNRKTLRRGWFFCNDCIQLMENVYFDLKLNQERERSNPNVGGWMSVFNHWKSQPEFIATWQQAQKNYNPLFQDFYNSL